MWGSRKKTGSFKNSSGSRRLPAHGHTPARHAAALRPSLCVRSNYDYFLRTSQSEKEREREINKSREFIHEPGCSPHPLTTPTRGPGQPVVAQPGGRVGSTTEPTSRRFRTLDFLLLLRVGERPFLRNTALLFQMAMRFPPVHHITREIRIELGGGRGLLFSLRRKEKYPIGVGKEKSRHTHARRCLFYWSTLALDLSRQDGGFLGNGGVWVSPSVVQEDMCLLSLGHTSDPLRHRGGAERRLREEKRKRPTSPSTHTSGAMSAGGRARGEGCVLKGCVWEHSVPQLSLLSAA